MTTTKIWECKIGEVDSVAGGADYPMRQAVAAAYREITGSEPVFIFSGWGALLTEAERAVVEAGEDTDGEDAPAGLYAWLAEYPEEGMLFIDPDAPAPAPANAPEQMPSERNCICDPYVHLDGYSGGAAKEGLYGALWVVAEGVRKKYVLADQVSEPKAMPVPATTPEQKRPINCGTGHCSCIECVMPDGPLYQPATAPEQCGHCGRRVLDAPWPTRDYKTTAPEHQAVIVNPIPVEYQYHYPDGAWRCSNGLEINGSKPTASRALYAERDKQ